MSSAFCEYFLVLLYLISFVDSQFRSPRQQRTHLTYGISDDTPAETLVGHVGLDSGLYYIAGNDITASSGHTEETVLFLLRPGRPPSPLVSDIEVARLFHIDPSTGSLSTSRFIDRDVICAEWPTCKVELNVQVQKTVSGRSTPHSFSFVKVLITLDDVNDNAPTFIDANGNPETIMSSHMIVVSEGSAIGTRVSVLPAARDIDSPVNGALRYAVSSEPSNNSDPDSDDGLKPEDIFEVETDANMDAYLVLRRALDRETIDSYSFSLVAYDSGDPPLSGTTSVRVEVADVNDNLPTFDLALYESFVREDVAIGTVIVTVHARDPDYGSHGDVIYSLKRRNRKTASVSGDDLPPFIIDPSSGAISTSGLLDFESTSSYVLTIIASNNNIDVASNLSTGKSSPGLSSFTSVAHAQIIINVTDVNDVAPVVTFRNALDGSLTDMAHLTEALPVGAFVAHVTAVDPDPVGGNLDCRLDDEQSFHLEELFRGEYQLIATVTFDRELTDRYDVTVTCRDSLESTSLTGSAQLVVHVDDINDNRPVFPVTEYRIVGVVDENQPSGSSVVQLHAIDPDIDLNSAIEYRLLSSPNVDQNADFRLNTRTGQLTTARWYDREKEPVIRVTVAAVDGGEPPLSSIVDVVVYVGDQDDEKPQFAQDEYIFYVDEELHIADDGDVIIGRITATDADLPPFNNITYILDRFSASGVPPAPYPFRLINAVDGGVLLLDRPLDREQTDLYRFVVRACSPDGRCDATAVRVHVNDINDNSPAFIFPLLLMNDTIFVGLDFNLDEAVTTIKATDPDTGDNGLVRYELIAAADMSDLNTSALGQTTTENYFRLDEASGKVFSQCEILHPGTYALPVAAFDGGGRRAVSVLYVIVNTTLTIGTGSRSGGRQSAIGSNGYLITVIIIGGTTCPLVALLLAAIGVLVYRQERHRHLGTPPPLSPNDEIYFRKSSALQATASVTSPNRVNVEYATLGRSRKLVPGGSAKVVGDCRSLARSHMNVAAGSTSCDVCCRGTDDNSRSLCSLSRDTSAPASFNHIVKGYNGNDIRSSRLAVAGVLDKTGGTGGVTTVCCTDYEIVSDSGRGSSEEMSSGRVTVSASPSDSPNSINGRCQLNEHQHQVMPLTKNNFRSIRPIDKAVTLNDLSRNACARLPLTPVADAEGEHWSCTMKPINYEHSPSIHRKLMLRRSLVQEHDGCSNGSLVIPLSLSPFGFREDVRTSTTSSQRQISVSPERDIDVSINSFRPRDSFAKAAGVVNCTRERQFIGYSDLTASSAYNSYV